MGNIIKLINKNIDESKDDSTIFIDLENCQPTEKEMHIYNIISKKLSEAKDILQRLENYKGATISIKEAIGSYTNIELQDKAWSEVVPLMFELKICYEFAVNLAETVPHLMATLCSYEHSVYEHIEANQATFKQFAEILDFILNFDSLKMMSPSIQNDLSYYRRCCSRNKTYIMNNTSNVDQRSISSELCSNMSLFYAESTPMLKLVTSFISKWRTQNRDIPVETSTECLATIIKICRGIAANPEFHNRFIKSTDTIMLCLRVMTAVIIIYDILDPDGVFKKSSKIDIKSCLRILKDHGLAQTSPLFSAIRFSTFHFNEESTPKAIKALVVEGTT